MAAERKRVMIAGAGGINSWLIQIISDLISKDQIPLFWEFTIFDRDTVEKKNLLYQNFEFADQLEPKAEILGKRYNLLYTNKYVLKESQFDNYDVVLCGVDNRAFRAMLFTYMDSHPDKNWIDLRAEGRTVAAFTKSSKHTLDSLMATLPSEDADSGDGSCQLEYELSAGIVQLGNRIIANVGAQYLLNMIRGEISPPTFMHRY